jgi:hypothetical protein
MNDSNGIRGDGKAENSSNERNQEKPKMDHPNPFRNPGDAEKFWHKKLEILEDTVGSEDKEETQNSPDSTDDPMEQNLFEFSREGEDNTTQVLGATTEEHAAELDGEVTDDVQKCLLQNPGNRLPCRRYMIKFDSDDEEQRQGGNDKVQRELSNGCSDGFPPTDVFPDDPLSNEKKRGRNSLTFVDLVSSDDEENKGKKVKTRPQVDGGEISDDEVTFDDSVTLPFGDQEYEAVLSLTNDKHSIILGPTKWHGYYARFLKAHDPTSGSAFRSEGDVLKKIGTTNLFNLDFSSVMNILVRHKDMNENPTIVACDSYLIRRSLFLEYPFPGGTEMEKIGNTSLSSLPTMIKETQLSDEELLLARQRQKSNCKSKRACMLDQDCLNGLSPGKWLNDTVVEFWTRWYV